MLGVPAGHVPVDLCEWIAANPTFCAVPTTTPDSMSAHSDTSFRVASDFSEMVASGFDSILTTAFCSVFTGSGFSACCSSAIAAMRRS